MMFILLAETEVKLSDVKASYGNLIFILCFFAVLMVVAVWWLRRG